MQRRNLALGPASLGLLILLMSMNVGALEPTARVVRRANTRAIQNTAAIKGYVREELGSYAAKRREDARNYSGTGMISCYDAGGLSGTAQLVRKKGTTTKHVLITAAHNLFNAECELVDVRKCYFTPLFAPRRKIPVTVAHENIGGCYDFDRTTKNDWAILELREDVQVARPYLVPDEPIQIKDHTKLTQVSAFAENFPSTTGHAVDCETRDSFIPDVSLVTTCSSGHGTSGSALIQKKRAKNGALEYWIYGISVIVPISEVDNAEFATIGPHQNYTAGAPLSGKFLDHLNAVLSEHQQVRR